MRYAFALDLHDDAALIEAYEAHHRAVWPEVAEDLRQRGILSMEIYRLGTRLFMRIETDDSLYPGRQSAPNAKVAEWEVLMWRFQKATPFTPAGEKWAAMREIFHFSSGDTLAKDT
jgi:L-rhamnose mutarotase